MGDFLIERARAAVQKIDLSEGERFLQPDFGVQTACNWVRHKFGIELPPDEVRELGAGGVQAAGAREGLGGLRGEGDRPTR